MKDPIKELKKLGNKIRDAANKANDAVNKANNAMKRIDDVARSVADKAKREADKAIKPIKGEVNQLRKQVEDFDPADQIEEIARRIIAEITSEASQAILSKMLKVIRVAAPSGVSFTLGPLSLSIDDIHSRIDAVERYARDGIPSNRAGIKQAILDFGPSSLTVSLSANFSAVVVNIDELGVGFSASWNADDIVANIDDVLDALGI